MQGYLGETPVDVKKHMTFCQYEVGAWVLLWIEKYGGIDGAHHKDWLLDQIAQIIHGAEIIVVEAKWESGYQEYRFSLEPTASYDDWVETFGGDYDRGINP